MYKDLGAGSRIWGLKSRLYTPGRGYGSRVQGFGSKV